MRPFITIEKRAQEALDFYQATFPSFALESLQHHAEPHQEHVMLATFSVRGQAVMISDSFVEHEWSITPGISRMRCALMVRSTCLRETTDFPPFLLGSKTVLV